MKLEDFLQENKSPQQFTDIVYPIKKLKVNDDSVTLILEDEKITLSDDTYLKYGLKDLKGLDEELYLKLKDEERLFKAYRGALRKLSMKDHTVKQIKDYLRQKQLNAAEINDTIDKLTSYGLLDDAKYCQSHFTYWDNTGMSAKEISHKLKENGISEQLITEYVKADSQKEYEKAEKLAARYNDSIHNKASSAKKQAILNRLVNHGFSYDTALSAIQSVGIESENELELLRREYQKYKKKYETRYTDYELSQRILKALMTKGFSYEDIRKVMEE